MKTKHTRSRRPVRFRLHYNFNTLLMIAGSARKSAEFTGKYWVSINLTIKPSILNLDLVS